MPHNSDGLLKHLPEYILIVNIGYIWSCLGSIPLPVFCIFHQLCFPYLDILQMLAIHSPVSSADMVNFFYRVMSCLMSLFR